EQVLRRAMVLLTCARRRRALARAAQTVARIAMKPLRWIRAAPALAALLVGAYAAAQPRPAALANGWEKLRVCADPNNLPFSNSALEGFENRLAEVWARVLGLEVDYTWFPHRRGFERNTLNAQDPLTGEYRCDVIMGVPQGYDLAMTTRPYYRSTYALVYVPGGALAVESGDELVG